MNIFEINQKIEKLCFDDALCQRAISIEIEPLGENTLIIAWQCNMASMKNADLKLPTVLRVVLDSMGTVIEAELMENFKGSQGIPCSHSYLNRILKKKLIDFSYKDEDKVIHDELMFHCRHIFELVAASITFYRYCFSRLKEKNSLFEFTKAFIVSDGLLVKDDYFINNEHFSIEENLIFSVDDIAMQADGKISSIKRIALKMNALHNGESIITHSDEISDISGSDNTIMSMMKLFAAPWRNLGRKIGVRRNYYFTNLVPSSLYGVLIQAIALIIFPNNYNYFQHSLAGLQRSKNKPLCVGIVLNRNELRDFYPEFRDEDLFN